MLGSEGSTSGRGHIRNSSSSLPLHPPPAADCCAAMAAVTASSWNSCAHTPNAHFRRVGVIVSWRRRPSARLTSAYHYKGRREWGALAFGQPAGWLG